MHCTSIWCGVLYTKFLVQLLALPMYMCVYALKRFYINTKYYGHNILYGCSQKPPHWNHHHHYTNWHQYTRSKRNPAQSQSVIIKPPNTAFTFICNTYMVLHDAIKSYHHPSETQSLLIKSPIYVSFHNIYKLPCCLLQRVCAMRVAALCWPYFLVLSIRVRAAENSRLLYGLFDAALLVLYVVYIVILEKKNKQNRYTRIYVLYNGTMMKNVTRELIFSHAQ